MSLLTARELHCDGCSEWFRLEYHTLTQCWPELRREGWTRDNGEHFCPTCGLHGSWEDHDKDSI